METIPRTLVTIVAEAILAAPLQEAVLALGATGVTVSETTGTGSRGRRTGEIPGDNVRLETVVDAATVPRILQMLAERYLRDYAIVVWTSEVRVIRGEKYS